MRRINHRLCLILSVVGVASQIPAQADSVPFWGAQTSVAIDTPTNRLKKGEFDEHLLETIASLSTEELEEVAHALREEAELKSLARR